MSETIAYQFSLNNYNADYPDTKIVDDMIKAESNPLAIIEESEAIQISRQSAMLNIYDWFKGDAPINYRKLYAEGKEQPNKVNNKIQHDFIGEIVDRKAGYMNGKPVAISLNKESYPNSFLNGIRKKLTGKLTDYDNHSKLLADFEKINNMNDVRLQTTIFTGLYGLAGRLLYGDSSNGVGVKFVEGHRVAFYNDGNFQQPTGAVYNVSDYEVRYYNKTHCYIYTRVDTDDEFSLYSEAEHFFDGCPLIPFINNDLMRGDILNSLSKINDIDERASDLSSEFASQRMQLMIFENLEVDIKEWNDSVQLGAISLKSTSDENAKVYYLNKDTDSTGQEALLSRTRTEIYRDSKSADFNEIIKSGTSGETRKWSLLPLENNASATELKLQAGELEMWRLVTSFYNKYNKGATINYLDINEQWTRDLPADIKNNMEATKAGFGYYPLTYLYSLDPNVSDPDALAQQYLVENGLQNDREIIIEDVDNG